MNKSFRRNRKAVSPVIATIIIVAVAIVMSIAVAYWMLGLAGTFTRYEKLEFTSAYAASVTIDSTSAFNITFRLKNTGSAPATLDVIFINGIPHYDCGAALYNITITKDSTNYYYGLNFTSSIGITLNPGEEASGIITLKDGEPIGSGGAGGTVDSGMTIEVMVQTTAGNQYPKSVTLP